MLINYIRYFCIYTCLVRWGSIRAKHISNHGTYHTKRDTSNAFASWWCFKVCGVRDSRLSHIQDSQRHLHECVLWICAVLVCVHNSHISTSTAKSNAYRSLLSRQVLRRSTCSHCRCGAASVWTDVIDMCIFVFGKWTLQCGVRHHFICERDWLASNQVVLKLHLKGLCIFVYWPDFVLFEILYVFHN